ncbi:MAG TPA: hypothetical protein PK694_08160, partial [Rhodospirillales bacterium]|nr:hypothetical protein [Rhodospirillales bacterium]
ISARAEPFHFFIVSGDALRIRAAAAAPASGPETRTTATPARPLPEARAKIVCSAIRVYSDL